MKKEMKHNKAGKLKQLLYSKRGKALCILTAAALAFTAIGTADVRTQTAFAEEESSNFVIDKNGVLTKYKGTGGDVEVPDGVTSIGEEAFRGCDKLTSITLQDGVTSIGKKAFYQCSGLTSITLPEGVTSIGEQAFGLCESLTSITLPNEVTSIGAWAFDGCSSLTSITIPEGVKSIGSGAFYGCSGLASITIPESVTSIGGSVFYGTKWLENKRTEDPLVIVNGILTDGTTCTGDVVVPDEVTSIGPIAFNQCMGLTSIKLPDGLKSIEEWAFFQCNGLTSITFPEGLPSIGKEAFAFCNNLTSVTIPKSVTSIDASFKGCNDDLTIYGYKGSYAETYAKQTSRKFIPLDEEDSNTDSDTTPGQSGNTAAQAGSTMKLPVKLYEWHEGESGADWYLSQHLELDASFTADDPAAVLKTPRNDETFWADGVTMDYEKQYVTQLGWAAQTLEDGYSVDCLVCVQGLSDAKVSGTLTIPVPSGCDPSTAKYAAYGSASYAPVSAHTDGSVTFPYTYDPEADHYANMSTKSTANYVVVEFVGSKTAQPSTDSGSYKVLEGADAKWTKGSADGMTIRVDGAFEKFQTIKIDGKVVAPANYTVRSGSTIVTLKNSYLETLGNGAHELTVVYTDGEVSTHFTIAGASGSAKQRADSLETGDNVSLMVWMLLAGVSAAGMLGLLGKRKRFLSK